MIIKDRVKSFGKQVWNFTKSDDAMLLIKAAAATAALVSAIDALRRNRKRVGFKQ